VPKRLGGGSVAFLGDRGVLVHPARVGNIQARPIDPGQSGAEDNLALEGIPSGRSGSGRFDFIGRLAADDIERGRGDVPKIAVRTVKKSRYRPGVPRPERRGSRIARGYLAPTNGSASNKAVTARSSG